MYMKCLSTFIWCAGWAYGRTLTLLHLCRFWGPNFGKLGKKVSQNTIMLCCKSPHLYLTSLLDVWSVWAPSYAVDGHLGAHPYTVTPVMVVMFGGCKPSIPSVSHIPFICCWWAFGHTLTMLHLCRWRPNFGKLGVRVSQKTIIVLCLEAVNHPSHLYLTSLLDVYEVFEQLHMLWMGIWVHCYCVTSMQVGAKFWKIRVKGEPK